ncbi:MAG: class I SAM-dependent methyltransferase [Croceivirga sp.]
MSKETFELLYDDELDMLVTHPRPINLSRYYESENYISHTDQAKSFPDSLYQKVKGINLKSKFHLVKKYTNGEKTLLDIGAGTGDFLLYVKRRGWKVQGVEPNPAANRLASEKGLQLKKDLKEIEARKFDVITLWHVLEHLPELEESLSALCDKLKEGGTLVIAVPNFKSFDANYYKTFWAAYDVPRHLWHFSKTAIEKLFSKQQMQVVKTKPMWFDAFYVSLLSEKYKTGHKNWFKALAIGLWSNTKGMFSKEHSSHIYILKKAK